jgi:hypothetical protein
MKAALALALGEHHAVTVAAKMCGRAAVLSIEDVPMAQAATVLDALKTALVAHGSAGQGCCPSCDRSK